MLDFSEFKKIIVDFREKKINRAVFIKRWADEQKRQNIEVKSAVFMA